jgi:protein Mpv17
LTGKVSINTTSPALGAWLYTVEVCVFKPRVCDTSLICIFLSAVFGPVATTWFGILQRHVVLKGAASTTVARVAADQIFFAPIQLTCFLSSMAIMEGVDPVERWHAAFAPAYKANLMVWPFVQGVNFTFVPLELRLLFVNVISLGEYPAFKY